MAAVKEQSHGGTHVDGGENVLPPDQYAYMHDLDHPDTRAYIKAERRCYNLLSTRMNTQSSKFRIWGEQDAKVVMTSRKGGYDDGEERIGNYLYVTREVGNHGEVAYYRKRYGQVDLLSEELINPQTLKQQFGYATCSLGVIRVSADGKYIAYTISVDGSDRYICHVKSISDASLFHVIKGSNIMSIEFGTANRFFYTDSNELNRPNRVMMVHLQPGLLPQPTEVYRDDDERFFVDVRRTKDSEYLIITSDSRDSCSAWVAPASYPIVPQHLKALFSKPAFVEVVPKKCWTWLDHYDSCFVMVSGDEGDNNRILYTRDEVALKDGVDAQWKELLPIRDDVVITDIDMFRGMMIVFEQTSHFDRQQQIRTIDLSAGLDAASGVQARIHSDGVLHFPPLCQITPGLNRNWNADSMQFIYSSVIQPVKECIFHFKNHMPADKSRLVSPQALMNQRQHDEFTPFDYDWPYHAYRDVCESADGTQISMSLFHMRDNFVEQNTDFDAAANSPKPCILYVYGSYGEVPAMHFQTCPYMWLLRRRFTVVFAHVRGGGEIPGWAEEGRHKNKMRTVEDFTACCEHLVSAGYTTADQLVVVGTSAGAVPIGAAMNARGDSLFGTAWLRSPFLDIATTMCDPSLPLTIAERREWGYPLNNAEDRELIMKYDPYQNINTRVRYPTVIVSTCLDDDRVAPWNAIKYVAKLRAARDAQEKAAGFPLGSQAGGTRSDPIANPIILRVEESGGHHHWSENIQVNEELAFLCNLHDIEGSERCAGDMDNQRLMENQVRAGVIDEDDAKKAFLRWEDWEEERMDFHRKLVRMEFEPGYRAVKQNKAPHFWVPSEEELEEKVNNDMSEKGKKARYQARSAQSEQEWNEHASAGERSRGDRGGI